MEAVIFLPIIIIVWVVLGVAWELCRDEGPVILPAERKLLSAAPSAPGDARLTEV